MPSSRLLKEKIIMSRNYVEMIKEKSDWSDVLLATTHKQRY